MRPALDSMQRDTAGVGESDASKLADLFRIPVGCSWAAWLAILFWAHMTAPAPAMAVSAVSSLNFNMAPNA